MGGKSAPAPDYSALKELGQEQLAFSKQQFAEIMPFAREVFGTQMAASGLAQEAQRQQMAQAADYYDYQQRTFRPLEEGLVRQAKTFDTEGFREQMAAKASADASQAFQAAQGMTGRELTRRGLNPSSGAFAAMSNQTALAQAGLLAGAANNARTQAQQMGWARQLDAAGLGRGLAGASAAAYGGANQSGGLVGSLGAQGISTLGAPGTAMNQGFSNAGSMYGNVLNAQTSYANTMNSQADPFASIVGMGLGGWASGGFKFSDRRAKQDIKYIGRDEGTQLPLYEFSYKTEPDRRFVGVMADDVEKVFPAAVRTHAGGYKQVDYDMLGIEMVEVTYG